MNNGSHTRSNRSTPQLDAQSPTEGRSTPDVSICGSTWRDKFTWCTTDAIGSSDHLPISITVRSTVAHHEHIFTGSPRWKVQGVDWTDFTSHVEELAESKMTNHTNVHVMATNFHQALITAATAHVGTVIPGKRTKSWITPKVRETIRARNRLRKNIASNRAEWLEACKTARSAINEAKTDAWRKVLQDSSGNGDDAKMWKIIKSLNGTPDNNSPNEAMVFQGRLITSNKRKADILLSANYALVNKTVPNTAC